MIGRLLILFCFIAGAFQPAKAQVGNNVLFLGNSYTGTNNLPQLVHDIALSAGDTLNFDSNTPGGYTLGNHATDVTSQAKIQNGNWDYVVIQGQSQEPVLSPSQFFSGSEMLYNLIKQADSCTVILPYMTWGRKNGDAANCATHPQVCTYLGMDTALQYHYLDLTDRLNGEVAPVALVWRYLRQNFPTIELYHPDESHPSLAGSYAAALCFYTSIFKRSPMLTTFNPGIDPGEALTIKDAVKSIVFDNLSDWNYYKLPESAIRFNIGSGVNEIYFFPGTFGIRQNYFWDFGDGTTSTSSALYHTYAVDGTYQVTLTTSNCNLQGTYSAVSDTIIQFCSHTPNIYTMNPWLCMQDTIWTQPADAYQWYWGNQMLPETNQFLDFSKYTHTGFTVASTLNGCTEFSQLYSGSVAWSGYYFDAIGNPCIGDTVAFAILHINGSLSGNESIFWYKNDTLLPALTNTDTLLITAGGKYECRVVNPFSDCPLDTTKAEISYKCGISGVQPVYTGQEWSVFPNPADEYVTIKFSNLPRHDVLNFFDMTGKLLKSIMITGTLMSVDIQDLSSGIYCLRLKSDYGKVVMLIKY